MKRGITPVITTLLIAAIMITSLIMIFSFSIGLFFTEARPPNTAQMKLTVEYCNGTHLTIRNIGSENFEKTKFYVKPPYSSEAFIEATLERGEQEIIAIYNSTNTSQIVNIRDYVTDEGDWYYLVRTGTKQFPFKC